MSSITVPSGSVKQTNETCSPKNRLGLPRSILRVLALRKTVSPLNGLEAGIPTKERTELAATANRLAGGKASPSVP